MNLPNKYKLGEIILDATGNYWAHWLGDHMEQGGKAFIYGNMGADKIDVLLKVVADNMKNCDEQYKQLVKEREDAISLDRQEDGTGSRSKPTSKG